MKSIFFILALAVIALLPIKPIYQFSVKNIDGNTVSLSAYKGNVVMIVNVASKCGYTHQYADLEKLYQQYKDKGFVILGFPANNFMGQEPGTDNEIKTFCSTNYNVTFPMFSKIDVKGKNTAPLYKYLTKKSENGVLDASVKWNFQKFLIDKNGNVISSFSPPVNPLSEEITKAIEAAL